jgi:ParB-like chromosome segregation protein Spo0J
MDIKAHEITIEEIKSLKLNPDNRNKHSKEQIDRLAILITEHGFRQPVIVSKRSGLVVAGHGRILASTKLGLTKIPVIHQDFKSEEEEYQFGIADNAIAEWATLDLSAIHTDLPNLAPFDIELLGLKDFRFEPDAPPNIEDFTDADKEKMKFVTCPHCEKEFELKQAEQRTV